MPAYLANTRLSADELRLFLTNRDGYPQDAYNVRWTVHTVAGEQVSGRDLKAIRFKVGEYYAPWSVVDRSGNYVITWKWQEGSGSEVLTKSENLFVVNPADYGYGGPLTQDGIPERGKYTYLAGSLLGPGDLPLYLKDENGFPVDAYGVFWTVYNAIGAPVSYRTGAIRAAVGEYYAPWYVGVASGEYLITWEYMEQVDSPLESKSMRFAVVDASAPFAPLAPIPCCCLSDCGDVCSPVILAPSVPTASCCASPCSTTSSSVPCTSTVTTIIPVVSSTSECCSFEIPRVIHLATGSLPSGGAYTNQAVYAIPERIRCITFYITYTRGAPGGYPQFKLLWGNGVEETQETMIDMNFEVLSPSSIDQDMYLQNLSGPVPDTDSPVNSILRAGVPGGATTVRLVA